ncbi:Zinc transporter 6 [Collichthys lucidus]|uniref:Zinc transporter 6 n=1 Tax=Collichthys lucidus TaxID=240159 RepID=A0A4U5VTD7_COLLU|nr:Zinc transporter 6 [Collichthys lucidus]
MALNGAMSTSSVLSYTAGDFYPRKLGPKPDVVPSGMTERKVVPLDKPDMVSVDVINVNDSDVHLHRKKHEHDTYVLGTIHPFRKTHRSVFGKLVQEFRLVSSDRRSELPAPRSTCSELNKDRTSVFTGLNQFVTEKPAQRKSWRILLFGALNLLCTGCLLMWCSSTNSMAELSAGFAVDDVTGLYLGR